MSTSSGTAGERIISLDQFRGFAIVTMVLANFTAGSVRIPAWLKHSPDVGLTVVDLIAPFFIFAIGLTFRSSWLRRSETAGPMAAAVHFCRRYFAIIGIGAVIGAGEAWVLGSGGPGPWGGVGGWGVLQAIGAAGILTLLVIGLPPGFRAIAGIVLLVVYQFLLDRFWLTGVLGSSHGGLPGSLAWGAMMILSTVVGDLHTPHHLRRVLLFGVAGVALGAGLSFVMALSKNRVSLPYVFVGLGCSALVFAAFHWYSNQHGWRFPLLQAWGRNPLALYILHLFLLGVMVLPGAPSWYQEAPLWVLGLQGLGLLAALSFVASWLQRRGITIAL